MGQEKKGEDGLTSTQRAVRDLLVGGKSCAEIAVIRGTNINAVYMVVKRLRISGALPHQEGVVPLG